jgi:hypothetical protein
LKSRNYWLNMAANKSLQGALGYTQAFVNTS